MRRCVAAVEVLRLLGKRSLKPPIDQRTAVFSPIDVQSSH
jgi:hypothetical protein